MWWFASLGLALSAALDYLIVQNNAVVECRENGRPIHPSILTATLVVVGCIVQTYIQTYIQFILTIRSA